MVRCFFFLLIVMATSVAQAGKYNPVLSIGDQAPEWKDLPGVDDKKHSLKNLADRKFVVLVFTCNTCPYAVDIEDRLIDFSKRFKDQSVELVAVNVNKVEGDSLDDMKQRAKKKKFNFSYVFDASQQIARDYGALRTPEFFVLDQKRKIAYMGAMDDSPNGKKISQKYLDDAITALLAGKTPEKPETIAIGCRVRMERVRRTRRKKN